MKKLFAVLLAVMLCAMYMPAMAEEHLVITGGVSGEDYIYKYESGSTRTLRILSETPLTISMSDDDPSIEYTQDVIVSDPGEGKTANLTIENVDIYHSYGADSNALDVKSGTLKLTLKGKNELIAVRSYMASIHVPYGTTLIVDGPGSLYTEGENNGAAIGGNGAPNGPVEEYGTIIFNGGSVTASSPHALWNGAAIGSGSSASSISNGYGSVTINGGTVTAQGNIGGGCGCPAGMLTVNGGTLIAGNVGSGVPHSNVDKDHLSGGTMTISGRSTKVTIGGGNASTTLNSGALNLNGRLRSSLTVNGGEVNAKAGVASLFVTDGKVTIDDTTNGGGMNNYPGVGGYGSDKNETQLSISGGSVRIKAIEAGIGCGYLADDAAEGTVTVSGGTLLVESLYGYGIGGGRNDSSHDVNVLIQPAEGKTIKAEYGTSADALTTLGSYAQETTLDKTELTKECKVWKFTSGEEDAHVHAVCGSRTDACQHSAHENVSYTPWGGTGTSWDYKLEVYGNATKTESLVLSADVEQRIVVGKNVTLNLCLNGHRLSYDDGKAILLEGGTLNLCDCAGGGSIGGIYIEAKDGVVGTANLYGIEVSGLTWGGISIHDSVLNMYGGRIVDNEGEGDGVGLYTAYSADDSLIRPKVLLDGVTINNNRTTGTTSYPYYCAAIRHNDGELTILNSTISGNISDWRGAVGLYGGTTTIKNTIIKNNQTTMTGANLVMGGGIYMSTNNWGSATLMMEDSQITGNTSVQDGAGLVLNGPNAIANLKNVTIKNNEAETIGGGVWVYDGTLNISGDMNISGNKAGNAPSDLYLPSRKTFLSSGLARHAMVYVDTQDEPKNDQPVEIMKPVDSYVLGDRDLWAIYSRDEYKKQINAQGNVEFYVVTYPVTIENGYGTASPEEAQGGQQVTVTAKEREGYKFTGWESEDIYISPTNQVKPSFVFWMPENAVTLKANYEHIRYTISYAWDGGSLPSGKSNPYSYYVDTETFTLNNPEKEGATFLGWTGSCGQTPVKEVNISKGTTGNLTFTANYQMNRYTVGVSCEESRGSVSGGGTYDHGAKAVLSAQAKDGYVFAGWYDGDVLVNETAAFEYTVLENVNLTARFEKAAEHNHLACGSTSCSDTIHNAADHRQISYTAYQPGMKLENGKGYYLTADTKISEKITNISAADMTTYLCLNGKTLEMTAEGDAIDVSGTLILCDCVGTGVITHTQKEDKSGAAVKGAGVKIFGSLRMYDGTISNNMTDLSGGGINVSNRNEVYLYGGTISGNSAKYGGGIYVSGGNLHIWGGTISGNTAHTSGGGVYASGDELRISDGTISGNTAHTSGGGVYASGDELLISGGVIDNNTAETGSGGGVLSHSDFILSGGTISNNTAKNYGGGIRMSMDVSAEIRDGAKIVGNTTEGCGGGISVFSGLIVRGGEISGNTAYDQGGGIFVSNGEATLCGGIISGNSAGYGGGVKGNYGVKYVVSGNLKVQNNVKRSSLDADNFYVGSEGFLTCSGPLTGGSGSIGVTNYAHPVVYMKPDEGYVLTQTDLAATFSDIGYPTRINEDGNAEFLADVTILVSPKEGGTVTGAGNYSKNAKVTVKAAPADGYQFYSWQVVSGSAELEDIKKAETSFTMPEGFVTLRAVFDKTAPHVHTACGKSSCTDSLHSGHGQTIHYQPWDGMSKPTLQKGDNYLYLVGDATYSGNGFGINSDQTVYLCLNGKTLTFDSANTGGYDSLSIMWGKLVLCDCASTQGMITEMGNSDKRYASLYAGAQMEMYGGRICGFTGNRDGMALQISNDADVRMYDGSITDNGGNSAVYVWSTAKDYDSDHTAFTMYGGTISGNHVDSARTTDGISLSHGNAKLLGGVISNNGGNGVEVYSGNLTLNGCTIEKNAATGVRLTAGGTVTMEAGTLIRENRHGMALSGGLEKRAVFMMNGGKVTGNTGPGVSLGGADMTIKDGAEITDNVLPTGQAEDGNKSTYSGVIVASGNVWDGKQYVQIPSTFAMQGGVISGNDGLDEGGGVYIGEDCTFEMYGGTISGNKVVRGYATMYTYGSGVYNNRGTFRMTGGTITRNTGASNGAVYVGVRMLEDGTVKGSFTMTGGSIVGNEATSFAGSLCGGVCIGYPYNTKDVTPYNGAVTIGGSARIDGNTLDGEESNIYLQRFEPGAGARIRLTGPFTGMIGVTLRRDPTVEESVAYLYRDDGEVTDDDLLCTFSDAVRNDPSKAAVYGRFRASGKGWFGMTTENLQAKVFSEELNVKDITPAMQKAGIVTVQDIVDEMLFTIKEYGMLTTNVAHYEVELRFSRDGGTTWDVATEDNFPAEGLWFELEFPQGSDPMLHDYLVTHMFASGAHAGQVEIPRYMVTEKGIRIYVTSLSPVSIAWQDKNLQAAGDVAEDLPQTGDASHGGLYAAMLVISAIGLAAIAKKRRTE